MITLSVVIRADNPGIGIPGSLVCRNPESRDWKLSEFRDPDMLLDTEKCC